MSTANQNSKPAYKVNFRTEKRIIMTIVLMLLSFLMITSAQNNNEINYFYTTLLQILLCSLLFVIINYTARINNISIIYYCIIISFIIFWIVFFTAINNAIYPTIFNSIIKKHEVIVETILSYMTVSYLFFVSIFAIIYDFSFKKKIEENTKNIRILTILLFLMFYIINLFIKEL